MYKAVKIDKIVLSHNTMIKCIYIVFGEDSSNKGNE